jgi:Domain of unknown function (DUF4399)
MKILIAFFAFMNMAVANHHEAVDFTSPKDKEVVPQTFEVKFEVKGMKVAKAGVTDHGTGHHHIIIDGKPIPKGEVVPADDLHKHYGDGAVTAKLTLKPGPHTLTLQFADGLHKSYGPELSKTINITVK